jgi:hypothetical protein
VLDGIPESIVIGVTMISGGAVSWVAVGAIFLSNVPEGALQLIRHAAGRPLCRLRLRPLDSNRGDLVGIRARGICDFQPLQRRRDRRNDRGCGGRNSVDVLQTR